MEENQINHKAYNYVCVWSIQWRILVNFENFKIHIETYLSVLMATMPCRHAHVLHLFGSNQPNNLTEANQLSHNLPNIQGHKNQRNKRGAGENRSTSFYLTCYWHVSIHTEKWTSARGKRKENSQKWDAEETMTE